MMDKLAQRHMEICLWPAANEYNKAILIVENNNMGWATLQQIIDLNYPNTFYSSADLQYVDVEQQMTGKINAMERKWFQDLVLQQRQGLLLYPS